MKNRYFLAAVLFLCSTSLFSESRFQHPVMIHAGDIYRKIKFDYDHREQRDLDVFEMRRSLAAEIEYSFLNYFSCSLRGGYYYRDKTDTERQSNPERILVGLKGSYFFIEKKVLAGGFLNIHSSQSKIPPQEGENSELFHIEGGASLGFIRGDFQFLSNFIFQTESNSQFKEKYGQQFRRHYQVDLGVAYMRFSPLLLHLESSYREPYSKKIDTNTRFWYLYPGVSSSVGGYGIISVAMQISVLNKKREKAGRVSFLVIQ